MPSPGSTTILAPATLDSHPFHGRHDSREGPLCRRLRRSGDSASVVREGESDLRGSRLGRRPWRRNRAVRPVVPGLQRGLDERWQGERLRRSTGNAVAVAAKSPPGCAGVAAAHHLAHGVPAPAALASQHRQAEADSAEHHQLPLLVSRKVAHVLLLTTCRPFHTGGGYLTTCRPFHTGGGYLTTRRPFHTGAAIWVNRYTSHP